MQPSIPTPAGTAGPFLGPPLTSHMPERHDLEEPGRFADLLRDAERRPRERDAGMSNGDAQTRPETVERSHRPPLRALRRQPTGTAAPGHHGMGPSADAGPSRTTALSKAAAETARGAAAEKAPAAAGPEPVPLVPPRHMAPERIETLDAVTGARSGDTGSTSSAPAPDDGDAIEPAVHPLAQAPTRASPAASSPVADVQAPIGAKRSAGSGTGTIANAGIAAHAEPEAGPLAGPAGRSALVAVANSARAAGHSAASGQAAGAAPWADSAGYADPGTAAAGPAAAWPQPGGERSVQEGPRPFDGMAAATTAPAASDAARSGHAEALAEAAQAAAGGLQDQAALAETPGTPRFGAAVGHQLRLWLADGVQQARIDLNPAELGPIQVHIDLQGMAAHIDFHAAAASTREALQSALPELAGALNEAGYTLAGGGVFDGQAPPRERPDDTRDGAARRPDAEAPRGRERANPFEPAGAARAGGSGRRGLVDLYA